MNICLLCNEYPPRPHGGIGTFIHALAEGLVTRGHIVHVVGLHNTRGFSIINGVHIHSIPEFRLRIFGNLLSRIRLRNFLIELVRLHQINVIETPDYQGLLPFNIPNCKTVVRLNLSNYIIKRQANKRPDRGLDFFEKHTLSRHRTWIAASRHILDLTTAAFSLKPTRSVVIYNPIPRRIVSAQESQVAYPPKFVLFAGAVTERKGALMLAVAMRSVMDRYDDIHLIYVGACFNHNGVDIAETIRGILGPNHLARTHFTGRKERAEVLQYMNKATIFAFPSSLEAFPLVLLEAMDAGLITVTLNIPPFTEVIRPGVNGILVTPGATDELATQILNLLEDPITRSALAITAQNEARKRFSLSECLDNTLSLYEAI